MRSLFADDRSPLGPSLLEEYGGPWDRSHGSVWMLLVLFAVVLGGATWAAVARRCAHRRAAS